MPGPVRLKIEFPGLKQQEHAMTSYGLSNQALDERNETGSERVEAIPSRPDQTPRIGVVIPAYNEEVTLGKALESVIEAGIPPKEIYVVDDWSTDRTPEVASAHGVNLVRNPRNLGKAESIKRLVFHQKLAYEYDLIAFFDADTLVDPGYFSAMLARVRSRPDVVLFIGQVKSQRHNWITSSRALDYTYMHDIFKSAQSKYSMITVGPGCASVYRTSALKRIYISNDTLAEDMDWTIQIYRKRLGKTHYVPDAVIHTQDPETARDYIRQIRRWYVGSWQVIKKHRIPSRFTRIDLELTLLCFEGLVYSLLLTLLPLILPFLVLFFHWKGVERVAVSDLALFSGLALYSAVKNRRLDIFLYVPFFYVVRYLNACVFLESFCRVYLKHEVIAQWDKVKRYSVE
jgi:biofilm PGA synthesis N-glycosyltransferase PgaC